MSKEINTNDDVLDSRDIQARIDELEADEDVMSVFNKTEDGNFAPVDRIRMYSSHQDKGNKK